MVSNHVNNDEIRNLGTQHIPNCDGDYALRLELIWDYEDEPEGMGAL